MLSCCGIGKNGKGKNNFFFLTFLLLSSALVLSRDTFHLEHSTLFCISSLLSIRCISSLSLSLYRSRLLSNQSCILLIIKLHTCMSDFFPTLHGTRARIQASLVTTRRPGERVNGRFLFYFLLFFFASFSPPILSLLQNVLQRRRTAGGV